MSTKASLETEIREALVTPPGIPRPNPTEAYWQHIPHPLAEVQSEVLPEYADIVIIGSGMTAVAAAKVLIESEPSLRIVVLEARRICSGATGRNGGHLKPNAIWEYNSLKEQFGAESAQKMIEYQKMTCARVREIAKEYCAEESEIRDVTALSFFKDQETLDHNRASVEACQSTQTDPLNYEFFDGDSALQEYGVHNTVGVMKFPAGAMWPYRLVTKMWEELLGESAGRLFLEALTPVESISVQSNTDQAHPFILHTIRGNVHANRVMHCTNGYASHLIPGLIGKLYPYRGTMTAQEPGAKIANLGASRSWSFKSKPTYDPSLRSVDLGLKYLTQNAKSGHFFFGGDMTSPDNLFTADDTTLVHSSKQALEEELADNFGAENGCKYPREMGTVAAWTGIMGFTTDGVPMIGEVPESCTSRGNPGEYLAAGFNGYGMPTCWMAGEAIAQIALGKGIPAYVPEPYKLTEERLQRLSADLSAASITQDMKILESKD